MSAKAYLFIRLDTSKFPPVVVGAEIGSEPLTTRSFSGLGHEQWIEVGHVRANTDRQAQDRLMLMVQGLLPCPFGDLKFLWPFLDPNEAGHEERYWLGKLTRETLGRLTPVATALNYARQQVRARREAPDRVVFFETGPEDTDDDGWQ